MPNDNATVPETNTVPEAPDTPEVQVVPSAESEPASLQTEEPVDPTPASEEAESPEPTASSEETETTPDLTYNGHSVTVSIPEDVSEELSSKGLDAQVLVNDLYSGDAFELSPENYSKAVEVYGKVVVDSFIESLRIQNDAGFRDFEQSQKDQAAAAEEAWEATQAIIGGGEEVWEEMSDWASDALSEQELADWDMIMKGDNVMMQQLAIKELHRRWSEGGATSENPGSLHPTQANSSSMTGTSDESLKLIDLEGGGGRSGAGGAITAEEFREAMSNGDYEKDPQMWDNRRRLGMAKGL